MASTVGKLKPFRGYKQDVGPVMLESGEIFFEYNENGPGAGNGKIKMGDGIHTYADLPYFLGDEVSYQALNFTDYQSGDGQDADLTELAPGMSMADLFSKLKLNLYRFIEKTNSTFTSLTNKVEAYFSIAKSIANSKAEGIDSATVPNRIYAKGVNLESSNYIEWGGTHKSMPIGRWQDNTRNADSLITSNALAEFSRANNKYYPLFFETFTQADESKVLTWPQGWSISTFYFLEFVFINFDNTNNPYTVDTLRIPTDLDTANRINKMIIINNNGEGYKAIIYPNPGYGTFTIRVVKNGASPALRVNVYGSMPSSPIN